MQKQKPEPAPPPPIPTPLPELEFGEIIREGTGSRKFTTHVWFDDHGRNALVETIEPESSIPHLFELTRDQERLVWAEPHEAYNSSLHWQTRGPDLSAAGGELVPRTELQERGYLLDGTETKDGLECEVWVLDRPPLKTQLWRYKDLDIHLEGSYQPGQDNDGSGPRTMVKTTYSNFETRPSPNRFEIPAELDYTDDRHRSGPPGP